MGNQLSGVVPVQMHPVEYYLSDISNSELISFDSNLGSTRFFKVARVKLHHIRPQLTESNSSANYCGFDVPGLGVAKVFVINDPSLPLKANRDKIENLSSLLKDNPSFLQFIKVIINDKSAILLRQYIKYNLYDRLSTRPFLTFFEKRWIAFQLLKSCEWLHDKGLSHGDIKLENILITSSLWVLLTDFATFKPVFLPQDNPADFSFFFDASRRRTCNIAPERFISEGDPLGSLNLDDTSLLLKPSMDLFSLGCVLAELFNEDSSNSYLFDLSDLLIYRSHVKGFEPKINTIPEPLRPLITNLIDLNPNNRKSAKQHLTELTPSLFPKYFGILFEFIKDLIKLSPDEKVIELTNKLKNISSQIKEEDSRGFLLLLVLATSSLRALKHIHSKIIGLRLLCNLIDCDVDVMNPYILDRVLPYLMVMLKDEDPRVRSEAIDSLILLLEKVNDLTANDSNVFPDYILPVLIPIAKDSSILVRMTLSRNLAEFASIASRFLSSTCSDEKYYQQELTVLQNSFQDMVSTLLTDESNSVRIFMLSNDILKLCSFFGNHKTNELILSHIFTFLNEKEGFELRCAFFNSIVPIASYLGTQCSFLLKPLLQQGISDPEETVIVFTLDSLAKMTSSGLLDKGIALEILAESIGLLGHPNIWIRHGMINWITGFDGRLGMAEICCRVIPLLKKYLKGDLLKLESLIERLDDPIPRNVVTLIIGSTVDSLKKLFDCLKERKRMRSLRHSVIDGCPLLDRINLDKKFTDIEEERLLALFGLISKVHAAKADKNLNFYKSSPSLLPSHSLKHPKTHIEILSDSIKTYPSQRTQTFGMNEEWHTMFGSGSFESQVEESFAIPVGVEARELEEYMKLCPPCINELNNLINHKKEYFVSLRGLEENLFPSTGSLGQSDYRPKGLLLAHLHEQRGKTKMTVIDSYFVSCCSDGSIKIWDASKMDGGGSILNRSISTYVSEPMNDITYCEGAGMLVSYSDNDLHFFKCGLSRLVLDGKECGKRITCISRISPSVMIVSRIDSTIDGYDLRMRRKSIKKISVLPNNGWITSTAGNECSLFVATFRGALMNYDLRFDLKVVETSHSGNEKQRKAIQSILLSPKGLFTSIEGNNEVVLWNCGSLSKATTLWGSEAPALSSSKDPRNRNVLGMVAINSKESDALITCGSDMKIRYWDLHHPPRSYLICDSPKFSSEPSLSAYMIKNRHTSSPVVYESKLMDGIQVIQEHCENVKKPEEMSNFSNLSSSGLIWDQQTISLAHRTVITDLIWISKFNQLVSSSSDGVIKVWK